MLRPASRPCLLVHEGGLVKTVGFKDPKYVGDPINAVKIFNEKESDELIVLDIDATRLGKEPDYKLIQDLAADAACPWPTAAACARPSRTKRIIELGVEKVCLSSAAIEDPSCIRRIADAVGGQSVVGAGRARRPASSRAATSSAATTPPAPTSWSPSPSPGECQAQGAGEIVINSVERDGTMKGYDVDLAKQMRAACASP